MREIVITKKEFEAYERVRVSGVTNMFMVNVVESLTGLSREKLLEIMQNYSELKQKYQKELDS